MTLYQPGRSQGSLVDILDKVLDKGLVVAGDIRINLADVELLTIKIRLLVCSVDKATEIGLDWWKQDGFLSSQADQETRQLRDRVTQLEQRLTVAEGERTSPESSDPPPAQRHRKARKPKKDKKDS